MDNQMIDALVDELLPELLPDIVNDFAALIGMPKTITLISRCGGLDIVIATGGRNSTEHQRLIDVLGAEAATKLMQQYGGERLYIPRCHAAMIQLRNEEFYRKVLAMVKAGATQTAAIQLYARQYGFTERWGYRVLSAERSRAYTQLSLFDN